MWACSEPALASQRRNWEIGTVTSSLAFRENSCPQEGIREVWAGQAQTNHDDGGEKRRENGHDLPKSRKTQGRGIIYGKGVEEEGEPCEEEAPRGRAVTFGRCWDQKGTLAAHPAGRAETPGFQEAQRPIQKATSPRQTLAHRWALHPAKLEQKLVHRVQPYRERDPRAENVWAQLAS